MKIIVKNKKAYFNFKILETFEAGIVLEGHEVKSIKSGWINLSGSYIVLRNNEVYLINVNIAPYQPKNVPSDYDSKRFRKLLLKKSEIKYLIGKSKQKGLTLIPLKVYTKNGKIKLEFAITKGKKKADKRELIKKRAVEREIRKKLKTWG